MPKRITPASAYQSRNAPIRLIMDARTAGLERDLKAALRELSRRLPRDRMIALARQGRWYELKALVDLRNFRNVMRAPFERIAQTYEAAAQLGARQINGKLHRHGHVIRYRKFDPNEPRDDRGRWTDGATATAGEVFVSPQIGVTNFDQAMDALKGERQQVLSDAYEDVDRALGLDSEQHDVVGAWRDGAENSTMARVKGADWETLRASAAMKGYLGNQRQVLVFQHTGEGKEFLASFPVHGSLRDIHEGLLAKGLEFHTLEPSHGGATVHVYGSGQEDLDRVKGAASSYGTQARVAVGRGEFVGSHKDSGSDEEIRADARRQYRAIVESLGDHSGARTAWQRVRDRWGATVRAVKAWIEKFDPSQPRDWRGRWTDTGAGDDNPAAQQREWVAGSPFKTIEQVVAAAPENQKRLQEIGRAIAEDLPGVEFKAAGIKTSDAKGIARVIEKAQTRGIAGVTDVIRIGFVINSPFEKDAIIRGLRQRYEVIDEGFQRNLYGYMDAKALVRMRDGQIGEIQIMESNIALAKSSKGPGAGGGHKLYDEARSMPVTSPARTALMRQSRVIYGNAIKRAGTQWSRLYDLAPLKKFVMGLLLARPA